MDVSKPNNVAGNSFLAPPTLSTSQASILNIDNTNQPEVTSPTKDDFTINATDPNYFSILWRMRMFDYFLTAILSILIILERVRKGFPGRFTQSGEEEEKPVIR